jgi:hypothetical protein
LDKRGVGTKLYGAQSGDGGLTWSKNILIYQSPDGTICECCHPSVAIDADGQVLVMWRNWLDGSRDMYLVRSDGKTFSKPEKLGTGTWKLNACPMDGGGLVASHGRIITAWRRQHEIFVSSPGAAERVLAEGMDVAITAGQDGISAIWSTPTGIRAMLARRRSEPILLAPKGAFPNIVALADGRALAAWEEDGRIVVQPVP